MPLRKLFLLHLVLMVLLLGVCFMDWAYFPELNATFSGANSEIMWEGKLQNIYGRPVILIFILCAINLLLMLFGDRFSIVYARLFINLILVAYAIKNFVDFSECAFFIHCPELKLGLYLMLIFSVLLLPLSIIKVQKRSL